MRERSNEEPPKTRLRVLDVSIPHRQRGTKAPHQTSASSLGHAWRANAFWLLKLAHEPLRTRPTCASNMRPNLTDTDNTAKEKSALITETTDVGTPISRLPNTSRKKGGRGRDTVHKAAVPHVPCKHPQFTTLPAPTSLLGRTPIRITPKRVSTKGARLMEFI